MVVLSIGIFICLVALGVFFESFFYQIPQEAQVANLEKNTLEKNTEELLNPKESQNIMITSIIEPEMKNGIFKEDGEYFFYLNGEKSYVGLFIKDNNYYYARPDGSLVRNLKFSITKGNNILPEGEFHFKEDGTIDKDLLEEDMEKIKNDIISNDPHSSRNLSMLKTGGLFFNNARSDIYQLVIEGIKDSPILGKGPYGDRLMTSSKYIWGHSHNIFLEILVSFGFLLGVPILLLLLNTLFALMSKKTSFYTIFYCVFLGTGSSLLTSNSFWLEPYIWGMVTIAFLTMEKDDFWFYQIFKMLARKKVIKND